MNYWLCSASGPRPPANPPDSVHSHPDPVASWVLSTSQVVPGLRVVVFDNGRRYGEPVEPESIASRIMRLANTLDSALALLKPAARRGTAPVRDAETGLTDADILRHTGAVG